MALSSMPRRKRKLRQGLHKIWLLLGPQGYLERTHLGDDFLGLIYSAKAIKGGTPNWRELGDSDPKVPGDYLNAELS